MKIFFIYFLLLTQSPAFAEEAEESKEDGEEAYCEEPKFSIGNDRLLNAAQNLPLVSEDEAKDPEIGRKLASEPGPYGHSELGFRYLARLFGYPGKFGDKSKIEVWLSDQEIKDYRRKKGLSEAWNQWVVNPAKRLSVPLGPVSRIPASTEAEIFFPSRQKQLDFETCISIQLKVMACENHLGDRKIESNDRVYFSNSDSTRSACKLVRNPYGYEARRLNELQNPPGSSGASGNSGVSSRSAR